MAPPKSSYETFFGKIVLGQMSKMPEWARVCVFLLSFLMMIYLAYHAVGSSWFVVGSVWEKSSSTPAKWQAAHGYDVRWNSIAPGAGTSRSGQYTLVMSPEQYLAMAAAGKYRLEVLGGVSGTEIVCAKDIQFSAITGQFEDYRIDEACNASQTSQVQGDRPWSDSLFPPVYAMAMVAPQTAFRVLATSLKADSSWSRSDNAQLTLFQNGAQFNLKAGPQVDYGSVPILPGSPFAFADGAYLPANFLNGGRIRLSVQGGLFNYTEEWFDLPQNWAVGSPADLRGSKGSTLSVIAVGQETLTIYRKYGDGAYFARLSQRVVQAGVFPEGAASPLGPETAISTLYVGRNVRPATVKAIVSAVIDNGVSLKRIAYPYAFTSTTDTMRLQLGASTSCNKQPEIDRADLAKLAALPDAQVQTFLLKFKDCK